MFLVDSPRPIVLLLFLSLRLSGCGAGSPANGGFPSAAERLRGAPGLQEVAVSDAAADFTDITALDVDSRGRIFVGDFYRQQVAVLSPQGRMLRAIGRRGEGPGEFRAIRSLQVTGGDSVLVYDPSLARVSVFAPDSAAAAYVVNLAPRLQGGAPFFLWRIPGDESYLALFRPPFVFSGGKTELTRTDVVMVLGRDGSPRAEIIQFPSRSFLIAGTSVTPNPFGREGIVRVAPSGEILYLWTDSLAVGTFSPDGRRLRSFSAPHPSPEVTADDVERERDRLGDFARASFEQVLRDSVPERWPAAKDMLVDDKGQVWIALAHESGAPGEWAAFDGGGRYLRSVYLPPDERLRMARLPLLYVERVDGTGVPRVVVYRVDGPV